MPGTLFKTLYRQLVLLLVVAIVLLAAYVSVGREFMPAVSRYTTFFEEQISQASGMPVSIRSLRGSFTGFNPVLEINGLNLLVGEGEDGALVFDSARIIVDMPRSVWQRRWVLEEFVVEQLEVDLVQTGTGAWQVEGMSVASQGSIAPEELFAVLQRVSRLDLNNVVINMRNRFGEEFSLGNGRATIQNRGQEHVLHIDSNLRGEEQPMRLSLEVRGNTLDSVNGRLHVQLPEADYSRILRSLDLGDYELAAFTGGGQAWLEFSSGRLVGATSILDVGGMTLLTPDRNELTLDEVQGTTRVERTNNGWRADVRRLQLRHDEHQWRPFSLHVAYVPDQSVTLRTDHLNLSFLTPVLMQSGILDPKLQQQLQGYAPTGHLRNLQAAIPVGGDSETPLALEVNLDDLELGSVAGSPSMWGIHGYLQVRQEPGSELLNGMLEVESSNFRINIPNVFTETWQYDLVNGRVRFQLDSTEGQKVTLSSDTLVAESEIIDGRVRFSYTEHHFPDGQRDAELELLLGVLRLDVARKSAYLPDGPNVQPQLIDSMAFLKRALLDGTVSNSAVIYRGNTLPGSGPHSQTFQGFFQVEGGQLAFSPQWPPLEDVTARVLADDNDIDIEAQGARSMDLRLNTASGHIRRNEAGESWLTISGQAGGRTQHGLDYLQSAPVGENLKNTFARWHTAGDFSAGLAVAVPLSQPGREPDVRLELQLADNVLRVPEYELEVGGLTGPITFDTRTGLERTALSAILFDNPVDVSLSSEGGAGELESITVTGTGVATPQTLAAWPRQSSFVRSLLRRAQGDFHYQARLDIDQNRVSDYPNEITITSNLNGISLDLPVPFAKPAAADMPLELSIAYGDVRQRVSGELGNRLQFHLDFLGESLEGGVAYMGRFPNQVAQLADNESGGLVILGELERFELAQWTEFLDDLGATGGGAGGFSRSVALVDLTADTFSLYDQELPGVAFRLEPDNARQGWLTRVSGEAVQGQVIIPYDNENPLYLDLDYLRLPGSAEEEGSAVAADEEEERVDALAAIDPRELPPMQFATAEFMIGDRDFGSWRFTMSPTGTGAQFDDLAFDFRGLRLGLDEVDESVEAPTPRFTWYFDGKEHRSALTGVLSADDIGEVLLANGFAASLISNEAAFVSDLEWPGSPAFFSGDDLSGSIGLRIRNGRFLQQSGGGGALKLVSIINFSAIMRRLRFSDDLLRRGLAFDEITSELLLEDGIVNIQDRLVISGPSSLYQITGQVDLEKETIDGEMYVTLPVSDNIPWLGLLTANLPLAVGAYLFDQIFGDRVDSLTSAVYTLQGPWESLQPEFKQAFGSPQAAEAARAASQESPQ